MYRSFHNLDEDKQKKIMDICIEEFARNGYERASTNNIVKRAGISKGILFHYFGSKKNLYLYAVDYATDFLVKEFYGKYKMQPGDDLFQRLMGGALSKLKLAYEYPDMYKILIEAYSDVPDELKKEFDERRGKLYREHMPLLLKDIDTSKFRKDIDAKMAIELLVLSLEALGDKYTGRFKGQCGIYFESLEEIIEDYKKYIDILKYGIYDREN